MDPDFDTDRDPLELEFDLEEVLDAAAVGSNMEGNPKAAPVCPSKLHIFPLRRRPFFPGMAAPIVVEPGPYYNILKSVAKSSHKCVGLILTKDDQADIYDVEFSGLHRVGVLGRILRIIPMEQGGAQVILNMEKRISIKKRLNSNPLKAEVTYHEDVFRQTKEIKAYSISIISTIKELLKLNPLFKEELQIFLGHSDFTEPGKLADFAVALTTASRDELQNVLETFKIPDRIDKTLVLLKKELDISRIQYSINQQIDGTIARSQREFFLREQLKTIRKELGIEKDDKACDREKFENRLKSRSVPPDVMEVIQEELEKLSSLEVQSAEYSVCRGYLDWLTVIPWGIRSDDAPNLKDAEAILHEDHYGLEDIKERILEFISVGKLTGGVKGSIIGLVGPPGVGKTSIGRSIARALGRKFYRFSVGGMRDEAEIKGHRRTYIGAMPGKLIQALKQCQTMNPVIMLDEVDKMGNSYQGDPASALLEVLDSEQNREFLDHYMDVRTDLSDILFIVTANVLDTIPDPLKDRMEILRLSGYIMQEKIQIAKQYLIPRHRKEVGIKAKQLSFTAQGIRTIINGYAREAGVRSLENNIKKILRKIALKLVRQKGKPGPKKVGEDKFSISPKTVPIYLGKPVFTSDRIFKETPLGVCTGLAWTAMGGAILYIETVKVDSDKTRMKLTGQAGDVMKESSEIAWSYLQSAVHELAPGCAFFPKSAVHIHIPEGSTPKDGPSAGITMVTAMLSLLMGKPVKKDLAMTGELTLTGQVLPIGGVKEKVIAARRSDIFELILPKDNEADFRQLADYIREGVKVHFVKTFKQVYQIAFRTKK